MTEKLLSSVGLDLYSIIMLKKSAKHKTEMVMLYIACCLCLSFHALIYIYQILAMNVAVNSYSNSLWTLLLSMQFSELKSAVFKRIDKEGLFQLTMADVVERFQLIVFLTVIAVRNFIVARKELARCFTTLMECSFYTVLDSWYIYRADCHSNWK